MTDKWYIGALKEKAIDYWNFNCFLRKDYLERYNLVATRTKKIAKMMGLKRVRRIGKIWYGVTVPTRKEQK